MGFKIFYRAIVCVSGVNGGTYKGWFGGVCGFRWARGGPGQGGGDIGARGGLTGMETLASKDKVLAKKCLAMEGGQ